MMIRLLLLFTIVPAVELFLLLQLGAFFGPTVTFLIILLTGVAGAWLAKREGIGVLRELQQELQQGLPPGSRLMEGALVVVGGLLLVTPGVFTDFTGFLLIAPLSRRFIAPKALKWLTDRVQIGGNIGGAGVNPGGEAKPGPGADQAATPFANPFDDLP